MSERPASGIPQRTNRDRHGAVLDLYDRHARDFDRDRSRSLQERGWLDRFLRFVPPEGTVLDLGCGTGEPIARYLVDRGFRVVGVDGSPAHLRMDDQRPMFRRLAGYAEPGAPLMFTSGAAEGESIGVLDGEPLYHASLDPGEYEALLATSGFMVRDFVAEDRAAESTRCGSRRGSIASRSAAYQELGIAVADNWMGRANDRELNDLVLVATTADSATWANVSESDVYLLRSYVVANLRLYETAYLQVEQKLLGGDALERLGWTGLLNSRPLERTWPHVRPMVSLAFAEYLEAEQPRLQGF